MRYKAGATEGWEPGRVCESYTIDDMRTVHPESDGTPIPWFGRIVVHGDIDTRDRILHFLNEQKSIVDVITGQFGGHRVEVGYYYRNGVEGLDVTVGGVSMDRALFVLNGPLVGASPVTGHTVKASPVGMRVVNAPDGWDVATATGIDFILTRAT